MRTLYYVLWTVRTISGFLVDLYDLITHRRETTP